MPADRATARLLSAVPPESQPHAPWAAQQHPLSASESPQQSASVSPLLRSASESLSEPPLDVYDRALAAAALGAPWSLELVGADGVRVPQQVGRWTDDADAVDERMLDRCAGPTLDLGCGPGRLTAALGRRGVPALGVDLSPVALAVATARGALALRRDLFRRLPGEGRWGTVLLADGNVGIGSDPGRLLLRAALLVGPGGRAVVEVSPDDVETSGPMRIRGTRGSSHPFPWAIIGGPALLRHAALTGWTHLETWHDTAAGVDTSIDTSIDTSRGTGRGTSTGTSAGTDVDGGCRHFVSLLIS
jgi:SAM-dependent methyltransferase